jgi:hypothetical protein
MEREVSATTEEFVRGLRAAAPGAVRRLDPTSFLLHGDGVELVVRVEPRGERVLGALRFPVLRVRYEFRAGTPQAQRRFLDALDRAMQRGGG